MDGVANAYIRDLKLENVDEGISVTRSSFVTVSDVTFTATSACWPSWSCFTVQIVPEMPDCCVICLNWLRFPAGARLSSSLNYGGHHGITLCGNDHLADNIRINTRFIHDLTVVSVHHAARVTQMALNGFVARVFTAPKKASVPS
jgi:hypothetical protein